MSDVIERDAKRPRQSTLPINRSWAKTVLDRMFAFAGLALLSPLLVAVAVLIRIDSRGPILFSQPRYGLNGTVFRIYKFRTMTDTASKEAFHQATMNDARITPLGRLLRNSSIDELPQLINVLLGDMALVGPRPHPIALDEKFKDLIPNYMKRYGVRPGISGLAQVSGHRGPTPTVEAMARRVSLDLQYIDRWSFWLDIRILYRTVGCVFEVGNDK